MPIRANEYMYAPQGNGVLTARHNHYDPLQLVSSVRLLSDHCFCSCLSSFLSLETLGFPSIIEPCIHAYIHTYAYILTNTYIHIYVHVLTDLFFFTYLPSYTYIHTYIYI